MGSFPRWVFISVCALAAINIALIFSVGILFFSNPTPKNNNKLNNQDQMYISSLASPTEGFVLGGVINEGLGVWVKKRNLKLGRSDLQVVKCAGKIYILGGIDGNQQVLNTTTIYDPVFETEEEGPSMLEPRYRFGAGCVDSKIYIAGGFIEYDGLMVDTAAVLDTTTGTWNSIASMGTSRGDTAGVGVDGKFFMFFGYTTANYDPLNSVEMYDPVTNSWTETAPSPLTSRGDIAVCLSPDSNKIVIAGGWGSSSGIEFDFLPQVELYDFTKDTWKAIAPLPAARGDSSVLSHNDQIHAIGGEVWSGESGPCSWDPDSTCNVNEIPTHDHFVYDDLNNRWIKSAPIPTARYRFSSVDANDVIYVFGGHAEGKRVVDDIEAFYDIKSQPLYFHLSETVADTIRV
jgi:N-acetylneuraminic acid mutarotase